MTNVHSPRVDLKTAFAVVAVTALAGCGEAGTNGSAGAASSSDTASEAVDSATIAAGEAPEADVPAPADGPDVRAICDTINNSFRCARAVERHQLPAADRATRRGDTLFLALERGDTARLVDFIGQHDDVVHYSYQDHWEGAGYFVVQKQYYEGSQYVLVEDSAGAQTVVADRPIRAPGAGRFAVLSLDLVAGYGPNVLQIWTLDEAPPSREWETAPSQWGPKDGRWVDSTTLRFTQHGYCDQLGGSGRSMCDRFATLKRVGGDWHLEVAAPDGG